MIREEWGLIAIRGCFSGGIFTLVEKKYLFVVIFSDRSRVIVIFAGDGLKNYLIILTKDLMTSSQNFAEQFE